LWNTFCAQLGCTPAFTEKAAGRFAFFLGNGTVEPDFTQDRDKPYTFSAQTLPAIFRAPNVEMERVTAIGIPAATDKQTYIGRQDKDNEPRTRIIITHKRRDY
jgi:hypothetical protein